MAPEYLPTLALISNLTHHGRECYHIVSSRYRIPKSSRHAAIAMDCKPSARISLSPCPGFVVRQTFDVAEEPHLMSALSAKERHRLWFHELCSPTLYQRAGNQWTPNKSNLHIPSTSQIVTHSQIGELLTRRSTMRGCSLEDEVRFGW